MTESLHLEVELPPRPIGTRFIYSVANSGEAEVIGYHVEHDTDSGLTDVTYRVEYAFGGGSPYANQLITTDVPRATVERALGGKG